MLISTKIINEVLSRNETEAEVRYLWLADDYNNIPDLTGLFVEGTEVPIEENWRSPFIGATLDDVAEYLRGVPKPPKSLCKTYFVVLDLQLYEQRDLLMIYNIEDGILEGLACSANWVGCWLTGHDRDTWEERYKSWMEGDQPT